jgi:single-strand DNA-binding protein
MSASVNKWIGIGRLGKDPEVRFTAGGKAVANFSIACDESYKDANGEKQKKTEWVSLVVWGNSVEAYVQPYLHKGDLIYVEGKLQTRSWEKDGVKKYTTEINITDIKGLVTAPADAQPQQQRSAQSTNKMGNPRGPARPAQRQATPVINDDDIGF